MATTNHLRGFLALVVLMAIALLAGPMSHNDPASAQTPTTTITVNTTDDEATSNDGKCSLQEAITNANNNTQTSFPECAAGSGAGQDTILFALGKQATIVLNSELPTITDPAGLTIDGKKAKITVSGNDAVRVFEVNSGAKLTLKNLTVVHGSIDGSGGGSLNSGGTLTVDHSTFSNNSASFEGGGIYNDTDGTLTVTNSTFSDNSAIYGGGLYNGGSMLTLTNSTLSGNSADGGGGGMVTDPVSTTEVTNATFSNNSTSNANDPGGGIYNIGTLTLSNTILANVPSPGNNCSGTMTDEGYNISNDGSCNFAGDSTSKNDTDPLLDPKGLRNNGGPTQTIALLKHSPAINAIPQGTNGCGTEITTDQRGVKRPKGSGCDIGAFEK